MIYDLQREFSIMRFCFHLLNKLHKKALILNTKLQPLNFIMSDVLLN